MPEYILKISMEESSVKISDNSQVVTVRSADLTVRSADLENVIRQLRAADNWFEARERASRPKDNSAKHCGCEESCDPVATD